MARDRSGMREREIKLTKKALHVCVCAYREKSLNDVRLDGAERLVFDDNEDLLLFFQVDEVTEPGFFGKPAE